MAAATATVLNAIQAADERLAIAVVQGNTQNHTNQVPATRDGNSCCNAACHTIPQVEAGREPCIQEAEQCGDRWANL